MSAQNKVEMSVRLRKMQKGEAGQSSFKSIVFKRSATQPATPTTGSFTTPVPSGWSDGIPAEDASGNPCWMTSRVFTSDGKSPQAAAWTAPQKVADTADFDVCFSAQTSRPSAPTTHGTQNDSVWHETGTSNDIWMATSRCTNGKWSAWTITRIKGEDAELYTIVPSADAIRKFADNTLSVSTISAKAYKITGSAREEVSGMYLGYGYASGSGGSGGAYTPGSVLTVYPSWKWIKFTLKESASATESLAECTVLIIADGQGEDGTSPIIVDLDNDNVTIAVNADGYALSGELPITSQARLYDGNTQQSPSWSITPQNCDAMIAASGLVTVSSVLPTATSASVTVTATYGGSTYTARLTISKAYPGADGKSPVIYSVEPSANAIHRYADGSLSDQTLGYTVYRRTASIKEAVTGMTVELIRIDTDGGRHTYTTPTIDITDSTKAVEVVLYDTDDETVLDSETVYVTSDGTDGVGSYALDLDNDNISIGLTAVGGNYYPASGYNSGASGIYAAGGASVTPSITAVYLIDSSGGVLATSASATETAYISAADGCTVRFSLSRITVTFDTSKSKSVGQRAEFRLKADISVTDGAGTRTVTAYKTLTVLFQPPGADGVSPIVFELLPNAAQVVIAEDGTRTPSTISCQVLKHYGSTTSVATEQDFTDYSLSVLLSKNGGSPSAMTSSTTDGLTAAKWMLMRGLDTIDYEDIAFVRDGEKGDPGINGKDAWTLQCDPATVLVDQIGGIAYARVTSYLGGEQVRYSTGGEYPRWAVGSTINGVPSSSSTLIDGWIRWSFTNPSNSFLLQLICVTADVQRSSTLALTVTLERSATESETRTLQIPVQTYRKGDAGPAGLTYRQTQWLPGVEYLNETADLGTKDICYIDIALLLDQYGRLQSAWRCKETHVSNADNAPSVTGEGANCWEKMSDLNPTYTPLLLADNSFISFMQGNSLRIYDSSNALKAGVTAASGDYPVFFANPTGEDTTTARWQQFENGNAQFGNPSGAKILLNAAPSAGTLPHIGIYDTDGNLSAVFDGNEYNDKSSLYGQGSTDYGFDGSTLSASVNAKPSGGRIAKTETREMPFSCTVESVLSIPSFTMRSELSLSTQTSCEYTASASLRLTLDGEDLVGKNLDIDGTGTGSSASASDLIPARSIIIAPGDHTLRLVAEYEGWAYDMDNETAVTQDGYANVFFQPSTLTVNVSSQRQMCRYFANGLAIGSMTNNYCMIWNNAGAMNFVVENANAGLKVTNDGVEMTYSGFGLQISEDGVKIKRKGGTQWVNL